MTFPRRRSIYEALPGVLKSGVGLVPFSWLAGPGYRRVVRSGPEIDRQPRAGIERLQDTGLRATLSFAVDQVAAYRHLAQVVRKLPPREALQHFPIVSKDEIQDDVARFLPKDFLLIPHYECTTGGTSGNQLRFYVDDTSQSVEAAFMHRQWARVGYTPRCRKATFRGVDFRGLADGEYWQSNPIYNELQFSPFHMSETTLPRYFEKLKEYRPDYIHGYPSAVSLLAAWMQRSGVAVAGFRLRAVLLGSEGLEEGQRGLIESTLQARVFSWYGHSERIILAGECEHDSAYHAFPDYGFVEIIDDAGLPLTEPGKTGELVGTGFLNRSMPLIRYRTGDRARVLDWRCRCGRAFDRFDQVEGRWEQAYVLGRSGAKISIAALNIHGPVFSEVVRYQYYQEEQGVLEIRVEPAPGFTPSALTAIEAAYAAKVSGELSVRVVPVDSIPLTARGKLKRLVQALKPGGLGAEGPTRETGVNS